MERAMAAPATELREVSSSPKPAPKAIGRRGEPVRALAFAAGGYNTALQLGVAHALLVSRGQAPDIVVGVSAGAVNAVALAEVLQAGGKATGPEKLAAQVAKFRQVLEAFRSSPELLLSAMLPDPYEVNAQRALPPAVLPMVAKDEREERNKAARARAGLIRLANDLLSLDLTVGDLTRTVRSVLGIRAAFEIRPAGRAASAFFTNAARLWAVLAKNIGVLAPVGYRALTAALPGEPALEPASDAASLLFRSPLGRRVVIAGRLLIGLMAMAVALAAGALALVATTACFPALQSYGRMPVQSRRNASWSTRFALRFFKLYDVANGLFDPHALRQIYVRLFDPAYYGAPGIDAIVEQALRGAGEQKSAAVVRKTLACYLESHDSPIRVGPIAANIADGELKVLDEDLPVVDALVAATALPPAFEAATLAGSHYVDGSLVSHEPTRALIEELRRPGRVDGGAAAVHVYPVGALPLSRTALEDLDEGKEFTGAVETAQRSLLLQRFRDATLDRRMTELYTRVLPTGKALHSVGQGHATRTYVSASVYPIEPERPVRVNLALLEAENREQRRRVIVEAVATGCRVALQTMLAPRIKLTESITPRQDAPHTVACAAVIRARLQTDDNVLPGSDRTVGPGLIEVCAACQVETPTGRKEQLLLSPGEDATIAPEWPRLSPRQGSRSTDDRQDDSGSPAPEAPSATGPDRDHALVRKSATENRTRDSLEALAELRAAREAEEYDWPRSRAGVAGSDRPLVNLVFSGGVFRGVFLMGVLNALNELGIEPDVIAGSSVGSISAAMTGSVFSIQSPQGGVAVRDLRRTVIARLASTFLTIDRLVLTDRLADFVRGFTLRAGQSEVSLRQIDRAFRRYEAATGSAYGTELRLVLAALERLFYVSPFEVLDVTRAVRNGRYGRAFSQLRDLAQQWLDRSGVGLELLGAEPLELLITQHVIGGCAPGDAARLVDIDRFLRSGIFFMATATNLTRGRLELLGAQQLRDAAYAAKLLDGLLASSAFPAVFRPRWSWEVMPQSQRRHQYVDGGVMDNLPLDAIAAFLDAASQTRLGNEEGTLVARRPKGRTGSAPHLLFTASLEVDPPHLDERKPEDGKAVAEIAGSWRAVTNRASRFSYNKKLDAYRQMQQDLRRIYDARPAQSERYVPLDIEVVAVKPSWLCGTFEFHPMLGFRRHRQAQSIAHGCTRTLLAFRELQNGERTAAWVKAWGVAESGEPSLTPARRAAGECWLLGTPCPFARAFTSSRLGQHTETVDALHQVYESCWRAQTESHAN
jgi:predicted acylesterase/phospholipase RssA